MSSVRFSDEYIEEWGAFFNEKALLDRGLSFEEFLMAPVAYATMHGIQLPDDILDVKTFCSRGKSNHRFSIQKSSA